jgi:hypothetical protein
MIYEQAVAIYKEYHSLSTADEISFHSLGSMHTEFLWLIRVDSNIIDHQLIRYFLFISSWRKKQDCIRNVFQPPVGLKTAYTSVSRKMLNTIS